jgi:putative endonuclease
MSRIIWLSLLNGGHTNQSSGERDLIICKLASAGGDIADALLTDLLTFRLSTSHPEVAAKRPSKGPSRIGKMAWVYILQCADGSYYTGMSRGEELDQGLSEHQMKLAPGACTASRLPVRVVYSEHFDLVADAIFAERKIKGWSRAKKEALIKGDWSLIWVLSKRRSGGPRASS